MIVYTTVKARQKLVAKNEELTKVVNRQCGILRLTAKLIDNWIKEL